MADIELDDFDLDGELDLDLDLGFEDPPPKITQGREAVVETASIAGREAASKVLGKGKERQLILSSLPKDYGNALESYDKLAGVGTDIVEQARGELRETGQALKRASRQAAPLLKKYLPAKIGEKLDKLLEDDESTGDWDSEKEDPNELAIASGMENLAAIQTAQVKRTEDSEVRNELKDQINSVRGDNSNRLLGIIAEKSSNTFEYTNTITNAYQRKMMELNFRQFFAQRDLLELSKGHFEKLALDIAAIVKNTALPDYAKEQFGEVTKALMQRETISKILPGQFTAQYMDKMGKNIGTKISEMGQGFRETASELGDGLEQMGAMDDTDDYTEEELAAKQRQDAAKMFGGQMAQKFVVPLRDKMLKNVREKGEANESVRDFGRNAAYQLGTVPEILNAIASGEDTGTFLDNFRGAIEAVAPTLDTGSMAIEGSNAETLKEVAKFDSRSYKTLNDVIPRILNTIDESIRKGYGDTTPSKVYDYNTGMEVSTEDVAKSVRESVGGEAEKLARIKFINKMVDDIDPEKLLEDDERQELVAHIEERARTAKRFDMKRILEGDANVSGDLANKLEEQYGDDSKVTEINNRMRSGISSVRGSFKDSDESIKEAISRFGTDQLEANGILVRGNNGYEVNEAVNDTFSSYEDDIAKTVVGVGALASAANKVDEDAEPTAAERVMGSVGSPSGNAALDAVMTTLATGASAIRVVMYDNGSGIPAASVMPSTEVPDIPANSGYEERALQDIEDMTAFRDVVTTLATGASAVRVVNHVAPGSVNIPDTPANASPEDLPRKRGKVTPAASKSPYSRPGAEVIGADSSESTGKFNQDKLFERLGEMYDAHNTPEARQLAMQPVIDAVVAALGETSAKPEATAILEVLQELSINGVGTSDPKVSELKKKMFGGIKKVFSGAKGFGKRAFGKIGGLASFARKKVSAVRESVKSVAAKAGNLKQNIGNSVKRLMGSADIYDSEGKMFLSGRLLKAGGYFDAEGEPIKSIKDIKGAVYDAQGNVVIDYEEVKAKIDKLSYNVGGKFERIVGGALGFAGDSANAVKNVAIGTVKKVFDKVVTTGRSIKAQDVYIKGEESPRLTAQLMAKGNYVSKRSGKTIYTPGDIDGEVLDAEGNVVISAADLADPEKQLVNKRGKVFKGRVERVKDGLHAASKLLGKAATGMKDGIMGGGKYVKDKIYGMMGKNPDGTTADSVGTAEGGTDVTGVEGWLEKIHSLLDSRLDGGGDNARSDLKVKADEAMAKARQGFSDATDAIKNAASNLNESTETTSKIHEEEKVEKAATIKDQLKDKADKVAAAVTEKKDKAIAAAVEKKEKLAKELKAKKEARAAKRRDTMDASGDGVRDGSAKARFAKFANRDKNKPQAKAKEKGEKKGSGFGALLSKLSGLLMPIGMMIKDTVSSLTTGLGGMFTKLLSKVGLFKGATTAATTAATAATTAGTASTAAATAGKVSKTARVLRTAATVGRGLATAGGWLLRGLSSLNPVGLAVLAASAVAYGAYRLATRTEHFDRLRYAMYGTDNYTHGGGDDVKKIAYLEGSLAKHLSFSNGFSSIRGIGDSEASVIASGMDVDVTAPEQYREWQVWFKDRFLPMYLLWTTRSYQAFPDKAMKDIADTDDYRNQLKVVKGTLLDYAHPAYKVMITPFEDTIDMEDLTELRTDVTEYLTEEAAEQKDEKKARTTPESSGAKGSKGKLAAAVTSPNASPRPEPTASKSASLQVDRPANAGSPTKTSNVESSSFAMDADKARNPDSLNVIESIRLRTYGLTRMRPARIKALFNLEDFVIKHMEATATTARLSIDVTSAYEKCAVDFGLDPESHEDRVRFVGWFQNRFLPVFTSLCMSTARYAKGNSPLTLIVSSSNRYLGDIAKAMVNSKNAQGKSIWSFVRSPWREALALALPSTVMARVGALVEFLDSKEVNEEKLASEVKNRKVEVVEQQMRKGKTPTAGSLADKFIAQSNSAYTAVPDAVDDIATPTATPNPESPYSPNVTTVTDVEADTSVYGKLKGYGTSREEVGKLLTEAATYTGIDSGTLGTIAMIESSMNPQAAASSSSAKGLYQFINSTWRDEMGKHGSKYGIPADVSPLDPAANALLGAEYLKSSQKAASRATKREPTVTDIYMGHFLGLGGMRKFFKKMQENPNRIAAKDFSAAAKANPRIFAKNGRALSYREVYTAIGRKTRSNATYAARYVSGASSASELLANANIPTANPSASPATAGAPSVNSDARSLISNSKTLIAKTSAPNVNALQGQSEVPNVDSMPGKRQSIAMTTASREAQTTIDNNAAILTPGTVSSVEVVAKTNDDLKYDIDTLDDVRATRRKANKTANRNAKTVLARREASSATVNRNAMTITTDSRDVLTASLKVQEEQRDQLAGIGNLLGEYFKLRVNEKGATLPSKRDPLEIVHAKGVVSTSRRRLS